MLAVEVRFLDEADVLRAGELVNPYRPADGGYAEVEFIGDNEVDVFCFRSNGETHIFRTHISRVASMRQVVVA
jgi:hypothetical protein